MAAPWGTNNCFAGVALLLHPEEEKKKTNYLGSFLPFTLVCALLAAPCRDGAISAPL